MSPCDSIIDALYAKGRHHATEDYWKLQQQIHRNGYLEKALASSINNISAKLMDKVGPEAVVKHIN
jgi:penicillin-binding protein 1A